MTVSQLNTSNLDLLAIAATSDGLNETEPAVGQDRGSELEVRVF